jgi:hypothetical protein
MLGLPGLCRIVCALRPLVLALHRLDDAGDAGDAILTIRRMASLRPFMEVVSPVSPIAAPAAGLNCKPPESANPPVHAGSVESALVQGIGQRVHASRSMIPLLAPLPP